MTEWYFVWVEGLRVPMPQKWSSDGLWGQVGRQDVIVRFTLTDQEAHLALDELQGCIPFPTGNSRRLSIRYLAASVRARRPSIGYAGSLNPGVDGWPLATSRSISASSSAVKR